MRVIHADSGHLYYEKLFKQLMKSDSPLILWQVSPTNGERQVTSSRLNSFHMDSGKLFFEIRSKNDVKEAWPLYCYASEGPVIFKMEIQDVYETNISVNVPTVIKILEDSEAEVIRTSTGNDFSNVWRVKRLENGASESGLDILRVKSMSERSSRDQKLLNNEFSLSLDEEDRLFADQRESPRARPKDEKFVKVAKIHGSGSDVYKLFDLSRGGLGFLSSRDGEFSRGSDIHIVGFNDFDLDDPLVGTIMSIRPIDGRLSEFKVGVKFSEGQD